MSEIMQYTQKKETFNSSCLEIGLSYGIRVIFLSVVYRIISVMIVDCFDEIQIAVDEDRLGNDDNNRHSFR